MNTSFISACSIVSPNVNLRAFIAKAAAADSISNSTLYITFISDTTTDSTISNSSSKGAPTQIVSVYSWKTS